MQRGNRAPIPRPFFIVSLANFLFFLNVAFFFLLPVWGILERSHQAPTSFLGTPIRMIAVPEVVVTVVAAASIVTLVAFAATRIAAWLRGELPLAHTAYLASHVALFAVGYLLIPGITSGWIAVNVWHNAQYLLFVWHFNNKRFADGVQPSAPFLSTLSQDRNVAVYALVCLAIATVAYRTLPFLGPVLVLSYAINFHHYVVDALIWKVRRRPLQETLGLTSQTA